MPDLDAAGAFGDVRSQRGNMLLFLYTNGTWVQLNADLVAEGETTQPIKFWHFEPYLRRTFKGTTDELHQVVADALSGKKAPPEPDPNEPPGLGPPLRRGK